MHRRGFLLAAFALSGCAGGVRVVAPANPALQELEPLYRAAAGREGLTIGVASNGCTQKADFTFYVERKGDGAVTLAFGRKRVDACKSLVVGRTDLTFTWAELGAPPRARVFLLNPLLGWTGPGS